MSFKTDFKLELPNGNKTTAKRKRYQKDTAPADDIITLIHLVRQNPALYNYKLQPNQRRRIDVLNGWAQIAAQIGNRYTVEECRRKWKNLRDTYHQYRLRKPKLGDGLSKWRYAKELEFLSNVYQPKLKSHRQQQHLQHNHFDTSNAQANHLLQSVQEVVHQDDDDHQKHVDNEMVHHHSSITLVNDDAETFILTAYEDVNDDMDHAATHMELSHHHDVEDVEIVKNEHSNSLDDGEDGNAAEVDYEEVCLYEEAANAPSVDCETIIPVSGADHLAGGAHDTSPNESRAFQYIDDSNFCIESINAAHTQLSAPSGGSTGGLKFTCTGVKVKNMMATVVSNATAASAASNMFTTAPLSGVVLDNTSMSPVDTTCGTLTTSTAAASPPSIVHVKPMSCTRQTREELDLFFDFLKKKMQCFSKEEITAIQVEFLNCVLRREAESSQRHTAATITTL